MNDNDIYSVDFTRSLPPPLKNDPEMNALGRVIAEQLQITARQIRQNIIYARIDELDEQTLDILAYDLHVDWYDYTHPIAAKRAVIKDSVRVHKRLGTLYAVKTALGSVYPESEIEEWFDYGGEHHRFRVVLDVTHSRAPADYVSIKKAVHFYKRLSAQMENMIYQCRVDVQILTDSDKYQHLAGYSGRRLAGTYPQRNTLAALIDAGVAVMPDGGGVRFVSPAAGTRPQRETIAALRESVIQASGKGEKFSFKATATGKNRAGEVPDRSTGGAVQRAQIAAQIAADAYTYESPEAGVKPYRNATAGIIAAEVETHPAADAYPFISPAAGTKPQREVAAALRESVIQASGEGVQFSFKATATGKSRAGVQPEKSTTAEGEKGGIIPEVTGAAYTYRVKRCGTDRCKDR